MRRPKVDTLSVAFGLALAVLVGNAIVSRANIRNLGRQLQWVIHTREVPEQVDDVQGALARVEAAQLEDALTGSPQARSAFERDSAAALVRSGLAAHRGSRANRPPNIRRSQAHVPPAGRPPAEASSSAPA